MFHNGLRDFPKRWSFLASTLWVFKEISTSHLGFCRSVSNPVSEKLIHGETIHDQHGTVHPISHRPLSGGCPNPTFFLCFLQGSSTPPSPYLSPMLVFDTYEDEGRGKKGRSWMLEVDRVEVGRLKSWVGWKLGSWEDGMFGKFGS